MKKNLGMIDIAKFIFAIGILGIHSKLLEGSSISVWMLVHCIFRLAVPFFFCASGYFFYNSLKKNKDTKEVTKKYLKRLLVPFCFYLIINLPLLIIEYYKNGDGLVKIILKIIRGLLFYPWAAMWYVMALIVAIIIIIPFYKKDKLKNVVAIGASLYLLLLLCNTYYFVIEGTVIQRIVDILLKITSSLRNGIFEGLFFVSSGMLIGELISTNKISVKKNNMVFVILYLLLITEVLLTKNKSHVDDHSLFISFMVLIPSLFIFLSQFNIKRDTKNFRNYSTGIYFTHSFVLRIIKLFIDPNNTLLIFAVALVIILGTLFVLYKVNNEKINMLIK